MSPKIHPVKIFLEKDDPQRGFRTGDRNQRSEVRGQGIRQANGLEADSSSDNIFEYRITNYEL
jgi:hypothetical protein